MQPKYEEKTFESYFNTELDRRASIYFPFGQVQEGGIGADASGFSRSRWLWWRLGNPYFLRMPFEGVNLREAADEMEIYIGREIKNIPNIKANLFFQYKRPELITSKFGLEWSHWHQNYFRYDIYQEQQDLLQHLASKFGTKALILYASPALEDVNDLVDAKQRKCLIENTNFRPASELTGHHRNTYIKAGTYSIACSEPEPMERFDLLHQLEAFKGNKSINNQESIIEVANTVRNIALRDSVFGAAYTRELNIYVEAGIDRFPLLFSVVSMSVFRELSGIQWVLALDNQ
ncbi:Oxidored_FMN domain-containing protein [Pseudomonas sp. IT-232MI5]